MADGPRGLKAKGTSNLEHFTSFQCSGKLKWIVTDRTTKDLKER